MFDIRHETPTDVAARERILDASFGEERRRKTCERLRESRLPADGLALVVTRAGETIATVRLWNVAAGPNRPALLLGPIAVDPALQGLGIGAKLMREALCRARDLGHRAVLLVGDVPYYGRFGFSAEPMSGLWLPGPCERERFLGLELEAGALVGARGMVSATGRAAARPDFTALIRAAANEDRAGDRLAA